MEFNPATMNPASIILKENLPNNPDYFYYIMIIIFLILIVVFYLKSQNKL
jgi:hypothetical protein